MTLIDTAKDWGVKSFDSSTWQGKVGFGLRAALYGYALKCVVARLNNRSFKVAWLTAGATSVMLAEQTLRNWTVDRRHAAEVATLQDRVGELEAQANSEAAPAPVVPAYKGIFGFNLGWGYVKI